MKFTDDTVVVGLISHIDESSYRQEVKDLPDWCEENNRCMNVRETKELVVDFRRRSHTPHSFLLVV